MRARGHRPGAAGTGQVIVDAAIRLFHERGFHGTSVRDIAREADVGIATLFHHHASKMALLNGIVAADVDELAARVRGAVSAAGEDPTERLSAATRAYARHHRERPLRSALSTSELRSLQEPARGAVQRKRDEVRRQFSSALADGAASGAFACDHPDELALALEAMCAAVAGSGAGGEIAAEDIEDLCVEMALRVAGSRRLVAH